jgi:uncharacterized protein
MATVRSITHVVNWFEIPVKDLDRAVRFYEKAFEVKLSTEEMAGLKMAMFPFKQGASGAAGSLVQGASYEPSHAGSVVYFTVEDIPEALRRITANGGKTLMPKTGIGEYGSIAHFEDTEGNRLALHSMK